MTVEWGEDYLRRSCLIFRKPKGKISEQEVVEYIRSKQMYGTYVHMIDAKEEQEPQMFGDELEDRKGDMWLVYEPYVIKDEIVQCAEEFY